MNNIITKNVIGAFISLILFSSCSSPSQPHAIDFYHWKSTYEVSSLSKEYMDELHSETLYLHVFDVVKEGNMVIPKAKLIPFEKDSTIKQNVVPVVFITNNVFEDNELDCSQLSNRILDLTTQIFRANYINHSAEGPTYETNIPEFQIDCDWTASTREKYFEFLKVFAEKTDAKVTSTIRLHQIKDVNEMGVPPVEKGYLMCYATSNPTDGMNSNSILDIELLKNYTQTLDTYPLELAYDLPLYSWGIVTNHMGKVKLLNGLSTADVSTSAFKQIDDNKYEVVEDGFVQGLYLCKGFTIEIEEITPKLLNKAKSYLDEKLKKKYQIVYFHLSDGFLKRYSIDDLK